MIFHILRSPNIVWWLLYAVLTALLTPKPTPAGWRWWTIFICWVIVIVELFLLKGAVSWR